MKEKKMSTPATDEPISREEWIAAARRVYLDAGDPADTVDELSRYLCDQEDWASGEVNDPREAAQEDIDGRPL